MVLHIARTCSGVMGEGQIVHDHDHNKCGLKFVLKVSMGNQVSLRPGRGPNPETVLRPEDVLVLVIIETECSDQRWKFNVTISMSD